MSDKPSEGIRPNTRGVALALFAALRLVRARYVPSKARTTVLIALAGSTVLMFLGIIGIAFVLGTSVLALWLVHRQAVSA
jgi:hypothetical protein